MNFKHWLQEEKGGGGLGATLIVIIIGSALYAVQSGPSNLLYEPSSALADLEYSLPAEPDRASNPDYTTSSYSQPQNNNASSDYPEPEPAKSHVVPETTDFKPELELKPAAKITSADVKKTKITNSAPSSNKTNVKPKRFRLSNEELVKSKLAQGKTVREIAGETGLKRKYIREVKRRTQKVIW